MKDFLEVAAIAVGAGGAVAFGLGSIAYDFANVYDASQSTRDFFDVVVIAGAFAVTTAAVFYTLVLRR